tara:strand:- start:100 stop:294 length:195 start_codon:yes stop_codon:yes gene_type:complete
MSRRARKTIEKLESLIDNIEKLTDDISLMCIDARTKIDKYNEDEHIEEFPELDHFKDIDEEEDK